MTNVDERRKIVRHWWRINFAIRRRSSFGDECFFRSSPFVILWQMSFFVRRRSSFGDECIVSRSSPFVIFWRMPFFSFVAVRHLVKFHQSSPSDKWRLIFWGDESSRLKNCWIDETWKIGRNSWQLRESLGRSRERWCEFSVPISAKRPQGDAVGYKSMRLKCSEYFRWSPLTHG